jgi:hypothetical protein
VISLGLNQHWDKNYGMQRMLHRNFDAFLPLARLLHFCLLAKTRLWGKSTDFSNNGLSSSGTNRLLKPSVLYDTK